MSVKAAWNMRQIDADRGCADDLADRHVYIEDNAFHDGDYRLSSSLRQAGISVRRGSSRNTHEESSKASDPLFADRSILALDVSTNARWQ